MPAPAVEVTLADLQGDHSPAFKALVRVLTKATLPSDHVPHSIRTIRLGTLVASNSTDGSNGILSIYLDFPLPLAELHAEVDNEIGRHTSVEGSSDAD